jgi:hypothetical protein
MFAGCRHMREIVWLEALPFGERVLIILNFSVGKVTVCVLKGLTALSFMPDLVTIT